MSRIISGLLLRSSTKYWLGVSWPRGSMGVGMLRISLLVQAGWKRQKFLFDLLPRGYLCPQTREGGIVLQQGHHPLLKASDVCVLNLLRRHRAQTNPFRGIERPRLKGYASQIGAD